MNCWRNRALKYFCSMIQSWSHSKFYSKILTVASWLFCPDPILITFENQISESWDRDKKKSLNQSMNRYEVYRLIQTPLINFASMHLNHIIEKFVTDSLKRYFEKSGNLFLIFLILLDWNNALRIFFNFDW